ncbi:MAG: DUF4129 domain-containing protein [Pirellulaceae bacterium]|nr:DUF4129 domain-containing protein [Pirellulaceae bacterium]
MRRRTPETLADLLVVAISPALIMLLVGSLVFFLVEVCYQGQYQGRLLFVLAMFVLAIVCVARIAMVEGASYAALFGLPLAVLVAIALLRFVQFEGPLAEASGLINLGLMALVWWSAHKLTWDCTLIDNDRDASGEGLLQVLAKQGAPAPAPTENEPAKSPLWWERWTKPDDRPHAPGLWVVYFSLAALPMFGVLGWLVPVADVATRRRCFWLLVVYVASALALLLATSLLGLRKYLRQRGLAMPAEMAATWVAVGGVLIVGTLVAAALVPRPAPEHSVVQLMDVQSLERAASKLGWGPEGVRSTDKTAGPGTGEQPAATAGNNGTQPSGEPGGQAAGKSGQAEQSGGSGNSDSGKSAASQGKSDKSESGQGKAAKSGDNGGEEESATKSAGDAQPKPNGDQAAAKPTDTPAEPPVESSPPSVAQTLAAIGSLIKVIVYLGVAIVAAILAWIYREQLRAAWRKLLAELRELWSRWFGKSPATPTVAEAMPAAPTPPALASFADPFASGAAARWSAAELAGYSFAALEAWGRAHGCPRGAEQTPHEFAAAAAMADPLLAREARWLAELYSQLAYAPSATVPAALDPLRALWRRMLTRDPSA